MKICSDRLQALMSYFPVQAQVFHSGLLCQRTDFAAPELGGQIHLVQSGKMTVSHQGHPDMEVVGPSLLFYPRQTMRRFIPQKDMGITLVCAGVRFGGGLDNPLTEALPEVIYLPLEDISGAEPILQLLFTEAFSDNCGREPLTDRLFEAFMILLLRQLIESDLIESGLLAGLAHPKLRQAMVAIHDHPAHNWSLDSLSELTNMSRSVFANTFRNVVGVTPGSYLQSWRINLTQQALLKGEKLKTIPAIVGYSSETTLLRAFRAHCGTTPKDWLKSRNAE